MFALRTATAVERNLRRKSNLKCLFSHHENEVDFQNTFQDQQVVRVAFQCLLVATATRSAVTTARSATARSTVATSVAAASWSICNPNLSLDGFWNHFANVDNDFFLNLNRNFDTVSLSLLLANSLAAANVVCSSSNFWNTNCCANLTRLLLGSVLSDTASLCSLFLTVLSHTVCVRNLLTNNTWNANCSSSLLLTVLSHTVCVRNFFNNLTWNADCSSSLFLTVLSHTVCVRNFLTNNAWNANCSSSLFLTVLSHTVCVRLVNTNCFASCVRNFFLNLFRAPLLTSATWVARICNFSP